MITEETPNYITRCWFLAAFFPYCDAGSTDSSVVENLQEEIWAKQANASAGGYKDDNLGEKQIKARFIVMF